VSRAKITVLWDIFFLERTIRSLPINILGEKINKKRYKSTKEVTLELPVNNYLYGTNFKSKSIKFSKTVNFIQSLNTKYRDGAKKMSY